MTYGIKENWKRRGSRFPIRTHDIPSLIKGVLIIILLGRLFYDSWIACLALSPLLIPFLKRERALADAKRMRMLGIRFKDAILSVAASQRAGYSVENAFLEARHDMETLYGKESDIYRELCVIGKGLANAMTLEDMLHAFAVRSGHPDILEFADIFRVAKRSGGNMTQVIADTAKIIGDKTEAERRIGVMLAAKRLESQLMEAVPLFIILYVGMANDGFFQPLYHNIAGIVVMTCALAVYLAAYVMTEKLITIEV